MSGKLFLPNKKVAAPIREALMASLTEYSTAWLLIISRRTTCRLCDVLGKRGGAKTVPMPGCLAHPFVVRLPNPSCPT
jgi:hypothetical protein